MIQLFNIIKSIFSFSILRSSSNSEKTKVNSTIDLDSLKSKENLIIGDSKKMDSTKLSLNFSWHEALYLPSWKVEHIPTEHEKTNIIQMSQKMEQIKTLLGNKPIVVSCWIRPILNQPGHSKHGQDYNLFVGSTAKSSMHIIGSAVDFVVPGLSADQVRELLVPHLKELNIRLENNPGSSWSHVDQKNVVDERYRYFTV